MFRIYGTIGALARPIHEQISLGREEFSLKYQTSLSIEKGISQDDVKELYQKQFEAVQKRELEQASTLAVRIEMI